MVNADSFASTALMLVTGMGMTRPRASVRAGQVAKGQQGAGCKDNATLHSIKKQTLLKLFFSSLA